MSATLTPPENAPGRPPAPVPDPTSSSTHLDSAEAFPEDLTYLTVVELQVLHSRITRQLDHDYLTAPAGPHPCTLDRRQQLLEEFDTRDAA